MLESQGRGIRLEAYKGRPELLQELNLDVSTEELFSAERAFTYADLYAMLKNEVTVAWLMPQGAVFHATGRAACCSSYLQNGYGFSFNIDGKDVSALARSPQHLSEICDVVLRLLAASVVHSVNLDEGSSPGVLINATSLAYLMEHCQSLKLLTLNYLDMDENHCRMHGA